MGAVCSWRKKIRVSRGMVAVGAVISGHTTHGSFVSPGLGSPANLSTRLPLGPALMDTTVYFDILRYFILRASALFLLLMEDNVPEQYSFNC